MEDISARKNGVREEDVRGEFFSPNAKIYPPRESLNQ